MIWIFLVVLSTLFFATSLSFLPQTLIPFKFSSKIIIDQHFLLPWLSVHYFECMGFLLSVLFITCWIWPNYRSNFSIITSILILVGFKPILSGYLFATVFGLYWVGRYITLTKFQTEFSKFSFLWSLWALWCVALPWVGLAFIRNLDSVRLIFLHTCALKMGAYLYETLVKEKKFSLEHTWHFFLSPAHFLILPSWVVCPFPSQFQLLNRKKYNRHLASWAAKKMLLSIVFFIFSLGGSILYLWFTKSYLAHLSVFGAHSILNLVGTNVLCGLLCFFYFMFISNSLQSYYAVLGFKMNVPIYRKPYLIQDVFDFWNRFLIQTKEFILRLFVIPSFNFLRQFIKPVKVALALSIVIVFFILDLPIHLLGVYNNTEISHISFKTFEWYLGLMTLYAFYYACRIVIPFKIQALGEIRLGKILKTIFWVSAVAFLY